MKNEKEETRDSVLSLRIRPSVYRKYRQLPRDWKHALRAVIELVIESYAEGKPINVVPAVTAINIDINTPIQIVQQIVERAGTRELREKLGKAEQAILCTAKTLQTYRENCRETCIENIKRCIKRYWG